MTIDPETLRQIEELSHDDRPLLVLDVDDVLLDFARPFLPESLAGTAALGFLTPAERLTLNHIRGHGYLYMFGMVEEFILPFVLDHARPMLALDDYRTRALLEFAAEEAKHIQLFKRFREAFEAGFGLQCEMIGPAEAVSKAVLADALSGRQRVQ